jgi:hypothetical protein
MKWSEFNFILMPSKLGGVGVFAARDFQKGVRIIGPKFEMRVLRKEQIPQAFHKYCIHKNDEEFFCPPRFDQMQIGWFINHSDEPNMVVMVEPSKQQDFSRRSENKFLVTRRNISSGDEILIDYNSLNEPEHLKESYYR